MVCLCWLELVSLHVYHLGGPVLVLRGCVVAARFSCNIEFEYEYRTAHLEAQSSRKVNTHERWISPHSITETLLANSLTPGHPRFDTRQRHLY